MPFLEALLIQSGMDNRLGGRALGKAMDDGLVHQVLDLICRDLPRRVGQEHF